MGIRAGRSASSGCPGSSCTIEYCVPVITWLTAAERVWTWMLPPMMAPKKRPSRLESSTADGLVLVAGRGAGDEAVDASNQGRLAARLVRAASATDGAGRATGDGRAAATRDPTWIDVRSGKGGGVAGVLHLAPRDHAVRAVEEDGQQGEHDGEGDGHDHDDLAARIVGSKWRISGSPTWSSCSRRQRT